jgi:hypothetical protein
VADGHLFLLSRRQTLNIPIDSPCVLEQSSHTTRLYFALVAGSLLQLRLVHKLVRMCSNVTAHACMPGQFKRRCASEFGLRVQILVEAVLVQQRKPA